MADNIAVTTSPSAGFSVQKAGTTIVSLATALNFTESGNTTVTITNSGGGVASVNINSVAANQNLFETIAVTGQSSVVADNPNDILTLVAGTNISITTNAATDTITINNTNIFGTEFQQAVSDAVSTSNSTTYVNKLTMTTTSLPLGTYRVSWRAETQSAATNNSVDARIQLNATTDLGSRIQEAQDVRDWYNFSGFVYLSLSGINTFNMDYRSNPAASNMSIRRARIELWRVT